MDRSGAVERTRILYIAGTGRSGTTLLANALGSLPGVLSAGEVKLGFRRGLAEDGHCGCRLPVRECPVWTKAFEATFGQVPTPSQALAIDRRLGALTRTRQVPWWLAKGHSPEVTELADLLGRLLSHLATASAASVIVDSSKLPAYGALLSRSDRLDVRTVHIVRDPRAVAWSWQRAAASQTISGFEEEMERFSPAKSSLMWLESSSSVAALGRRAGHPVRAVRYEDLVADPARTLRRILQMADLTDLADPATIVTEQGLEVGTSHAIAGNPNRVRTGPLPLRHDDEWVTAMPRGQRRLVSAVTAPRRRIHGY